MRVICIIAHMSLELSLLVGFFLDKENLSDLYLPATTHTFTVLEKSSGLGNNLNQI